MDINYWAVLSCVLLSLVLGFVWYGPLFGRKWIEINELSSEDIAKREAMQKAAGPLYFIQFSLSLLQLCILTTFLYAYHRYINLLGSCVEMGQCISSTETYISASFMIWLGFIMPTVAGLAMWNTKPTKVRWTLFLISSGYQLISFVSFGFILSTWQ